MDEVIELTGLLSRSPTRVRILEALNQNGRLKKENLKATIDASRTTITRNLDVLEDHGWIRTGHQEHAITPAGRAIVEDFQDLVETMDVSVRLEEFFRWVPATEFDLDLQHLAEADIMVGEPGDPYAMVNRHVSKLETMEECRSLLPFTGLHAAEAATGQIENEDARVTVIVEPDVADTFESNPQYAELIDDVVADGRMDVLVYDDTIPYNLNIIDETVQILVAEGDEPRALLESDAEAVYDWAVHTFENYRAPATPVSE